MMWTVAIWWGMLAGGAQPPVAALAFTPDGRWLIAGSQSGVAVHRWPDLTLAYQAPCRMLQIHDVAVSPDGKLMAVAGGSPAEWGAVEILNVEAGRPIQLLATHADVVYSVAWSDDGKRLLTASLDRACHLLDVDGGKRLSEFTGHSRGVTAAEFLPGSDRFVTAGLDNNLRVWRLSDSKPERSLDNHTQPIHSLAVRLGPEGTPTMVATASDDQTVRFWQPTIGRMVRFVRFPVAVPLDCCWSGGLLAVACNDGRVRVIDPAAADVVHDLAVLDGWLYAIAAHPNGRELTAAGDHGRIRRVVIPFGD